MNAETWQSNNNQYLTAALRCLRLRLEQLARQHYPLAPVGQPSVVAAKPRPEARQVEPSLFDPPTEPEPIATAPPPLFEDGDAGFQAQLVEAIAARTAAAQMQPPPALLILADQLGLTPFEQEILLLCAAVEFDTRVSTLCARVQDHANRACPTFALALALFEDASWDALAPQRPLRYWRLIEINQPGATPLTISALRTDERIVNYLKGLNRVDDRLLPFFQPLAALSDSYALSSSQHRAVESIVSQWRNVTDLSTLPVAQLLGIDAQSKQLVAQEVATSLDRQLYYLRSTRLPSQLAEQETLARLWQRESLLLPVALYLDVQEYEGGESIGDLTHLDHFLNCDLGIVLLGTRHAPLPLNGPTFSVDVDRPTAEEQRLAWFDALHSMAQIPTLAIAPADAEVAARQLSGQFSLNLSEIRSIATNAMATMLVSINEEALSDAALSEATQSAAAPEDATLDAEASKQGASNKMMWQEEIWDACRAITRPRLDTLAQRLDIKATWDDLVLPEEQTRLLHQVADQVRQRSTVYDEWGFGDKMNRGKGISALFAGDSGTGKTMAAEVIANDLRLNLYRIDLAAVVSKYIGETEKNLRRLFDAAEMGGAILFFDEADALFGKRSEVKDSHDRYANIEINYLLQRMEGFNGLAILATNMKNALDTAFMRRLRFIVNFPFPGVSERKLMWQKAFPARLPKGDIDYDRLARFNLTGGNIHSIALNAAFIAAHSGEVLTMPTIMGAARTEFRKLDRSISEAEFRL